VDENSARLNKRGVLNTQVALFKAVMAHLVTSSQTRAQVFTTTPNPKPPKPPCTTTVAANRPCEFSLVVLSVSAQHARGAGGGRGGRPTENSDLVTCGPNAGGPRDVAC